MSTRYTFHLRSMLIITCSVSEEEDAAGRGMLSAMVVHKDDRVPGPGFFVLAKRLGRDVSDRDNCWGKEMKLIYASAQAK